MSYRGVVATIPCGIGSLNANENLADIPPQDWQTAEGVTFEGRALRKAPGASLYDASGVSGDPAILAGVDWWPDDSTQRMVLAAADGVLYKDNAGDTDATSLATGLSTTARGVFAEAGSETTGAVRKLIYFNGTDAPKVLDADGAAATSLSNPPADWTGAYQPIGGCVHGQGLWGWGNTNRPHQIYRSDPEDHENFLTSEAVTLTVYPGVGRRIVAAREHEQKLFLFKYPRGLYVLDDTDVRSSYWTVAEISRSIGVCQSPQAALEVPGDVLFLSAYGSFHLLSPILAATDAEGLRRSNLSDRLHIEGWLRDHVNMARLSQVQSCWYEAKSLAIFALPEAGETTNELFLMFDFSQVGDRGLPQVSYTTRDDCSALWIRTAADGIARPVAGDSLGNVYLLEQSTRSKAGVGYTSSARTADTDFGWIDQGLASKYKNLDFFQLDCTPKGTCSVTVTTYLDGTADQVLTFDANARRHKARIRGSCQYFGYGITHSTAGEDFSIAAARVYFRPGREIPLRSGGATQASSGETTVTIYRGYQDVAEGDRSVTILEAGATGAYIASVTPSWNATVYETSHLTGQFTFTFSVPAPASAYVRWTVTPASA